MFGKFKLFLLALSVTMMTGLCGCDNGPELSEIPAAVENTISKTNIEGAKSINYMSSSNTRGYSEPGYYVVFDDGRIEPFGIYNSKGKLQKVEISNIKSIGSVLLIEPNYYDCCKAIGKENGKTEEEANLLEKIFRQLIVDKKTGKIYTLPTDCYDKLLTTGYSTDKEGNIYTIYGWQAGEKLAKLNTSNFSLTVTPIIGLANNVKIAEDNTIFYWNSYDMAGGSIEEAGLGVILNNGEIYYFEDAKGNIKFLNGTCYTLIEGKLSKLVYSGNKPVLETVASTEDQYFRSIIYNPEKNSLLLYGGNSATEFNAVEFTEDNITKVNISDKIDVSALTNPIERGGYWYLVNSFDSHNPYFYSVDMNTYEVEQINVKGLSAIGLIEGVNISENPDYILFLYCLRNQDGAEVICGVDFNGNTTIVSENDRNSYTFDLIPLN